MHPIRLNHATGVPVFQQIVEQITYMIETGQLDDGDQLPSSRMLADNLHVNRNTVARAYKELEAEGLVTTRRRAGTVVAPHAQPLDVALHRSAADYATKATRAGLSDSAAIDLVRAALRDARARGE